MADDLLHPVDMSDLDKELIDVREKSLELWRTASTDTGKAAALRNLLKAIRFRSELRERAQRPEQLAKLQEQIEEVRAIIKGSRGTGSAFRGRADDHVTGKEPAWRTGPAG